MGKRAQLNSDAGSSRVQNHKIHWVPRLPAHDELVPIPTTAECPLLFSLVSGVWNRLSLSIKIQTPPGRPHPKEARLPSLRSLYQNADPSLG